MTSTPQTRMAMIDAYPPAVRALVHEHPYPIVHLGIHQFGTGNVALLAAWCDRQRRQRQADLLASISGVGAAMAKGMRR